MDSAAKSCAVIRNPFSTVTTSPKIPDGAVPSSLTIRECTSNSYSTDRGMLTFCLYPGFFGGAGVIRGDGKTNAIVIHEHSDPSRQTVVKSIGTNVLEVSNSNECPNGWRVVSQGMRLSLLNNSEKNDGWFEAIRINPSYDDYDFKFVAKDTDTFGANAECVCVPDLMIFENKILNPSKDVVDPNSNAQTIPYNWANHPSYISGKLRDLHKYTFMLKNHSDDHTFTRVEQNEVCVITTPTTEAEKAVAKVQRWSGNSFCYVDKNMDVVLVRCISQMDSNMYVHMQSIQYTENIHDAQSSLSKYQTSCPVAKKLIEGTKTALNKDPRPGYMRLPKTPINLYKK